MAIAPTWNNPLLHYVRRIEIGPCYKLAGGTARELRLYGDGPRPVVVTAASTDLDAPIDVIIAEQPEIVGG